MAAAFSETSLPASYIWNTFMSREPSLSSGTSNDHRAPPRARGFSIVTTDLSDDTLLDLKLEVKRETRQFCTGSSYTGCGNWNANNMSGYGVYVLPHGVVYEGEMRDGMFHGEGSLRYPCGQIVQGIWVRGRMTFFKFQFVDELCFQDPWGYLKPFDRRFAIELEGNMRPVDKEYLTNTQPTRTISPGCYDLGNAEYNPESKRFRPMGRQRSSFAFIDHEDQKEELDLNVDVNLFAMKNKFKFSKREAWIEKHCRKSWDVATGYRPDLYEYWFSGRWSEIWMIEDELHRKHRPKSAFLVDIVPKSSIV